MVTTDVPDHIYSPGPRFHLLVGTGSDLVTGCFWYLVVAVASSSSFRIFRGRFLESFLHWFLQGFHHKFLGGLRVIFVHSSLMLVPLAGFEYICVLLLMGSW